MTLVEGKCIHCGKIIKVPNDRNECFCQYCGKKMPSISAVAASTSFSSTPRLSSNPNIITNEQKKPSSLLDNWKTSAGASVGGFLVAACINYSSGYIDPVIDFCIAFVYAAFSIIYALGIYPKYFSNMPLLKSNIGISFLNCFAGGVFGLFWNHNLTRKVMGVSHIVYATLGIIMMIYSFTTLYLAFNYS